MKHFKNSGGHLVNLGVDRVKLTPDLHLCLEAMLYHCNTLGYVPTKTPLTQPSPEI